MSSPFPPQRRQTVMQYSLRGMMLATFGIAIACAVVVPLLKYFNIDAVVLQKTFAGALLGATVTVSYRCVIRYKLEQKCGPQLAAIGTQSKASRRWAIGGGFIYGVQQIAFAISSGSRMPHDWMPAVMSFIGGGLLAGAFLALWWKGVTHSCELCENGILLGSWRFHEWQKFRGYRRAFDNSLQLLLKHDFITLRVPPDQEPRVIEIFDTHIPGNGTPPSVGQKPQP